MNRAAQATTTLKLETCSFTDMRMYPGMGTIQISKDGKTHTLSTRKVASLFRQKVKPVKLRWTQAWRRNNKKAVAHTGTGKKRTRHVVRAQKAIVGLSLDDLQKKRAAAASAKKEAPAGNAPANATKITSATKAKRAGKAKAAATQAAK